MSFIELYFVPDFHGLEELWKMPSEFFPVVSVFYETRYFRATKTPFQQWKLLLYFTITQFKTWTKTIVTTTLPVCVVRMVMEESPLLPGNRRLQTTSGLFSIWPEIALAQSWPKIKETSWPTPCSPMSWLPGNSRMLSALLKLIIYWSVKTVCLICCWCWHIMTIFSMHKWPILMLWIYFDCFRIHNAHSVQ